MKKRKGLVILLALVMVLAGCGGASKDAATEDVVYQEAVAESTTADFGNGSYDVKYEEAEAEIAEDGSGATEGSVATATTRKLIKNVDMNVETREFEELVSLIEAKVNSLGGYIEESNIYNGSTYHSYKELKHGYLQLRVPQDKLEEFISDVQGVSNVTRCNRSVRDITLEYVDVESHKKALEVEQERLLQLLELAQNVEDVITIESRLSEVRYELESIESRLRTFDNQVDYSTVYMDINEVEELTPVVKETIGARIARGFGNSLENVFEGIGDFFIGLIIYLPYLVEWGIIIGVAILIVRFIIRRKGKKK